VETVVSGRLILCATPIGNLEDITQRALRVLGSADVIACEDTRRTRKLLNHFSIRARDLVSYHEGNERRAAADLLQRIERGKTVVLVSDAGMPGISDPGYRLVRACIEANLKIEVVPGPTASVTALVLSGLPPGRFVFEGFLPRRTGDRKRRAAELAPETRTLVIYESPHRLAASVADLIEVLGDRPAALVRELTKMHEEVRRGSLTEILDSIRESPPKGEIVLVVGGAIHDRAVASREELARAARELMDSGIDRGEALSRVAKQAGVPRRRVFDALLDERE
jgi:16S rRNA (cytidine1402-2'-O)-methyltransferase